MINLNTGIGFGEANDPSDLASLGGAVERATGLTPWVPHTDTPGTARSYPEAGTSDEFTSGFSGGLRGFQMASGLDPDGVAWPGGPTHQALNSQSVGTAPDRKTVFGEAGATGTPATRKKAAISPSRPKDGGVAAAKALRAQSTRNTAKSSVSANRQRPPAGPRPGSDPSGFGLGSRSASAPVPLIAPPKIRQAVGRGGVNAGVDLLQAQRNLARVGHAPRVVQGRQAPSAGAPLQRQQAAIQPSVIAQAIMGFQRDKDLKPDGRMDPDGPTERRLRGQIKTQQQRLKQDWEREVDKVIADAKAGRDGTSGITTQASARTLAARRTGAKLDKALAEKLAETLRRAKARSRDPGTILESRIAEEVIGKAPAPQKAHPADPLAALAQRGQLNNPQWLRSQIADALGTTPDMLSDPMKRLTGFPLGQLRNLTRTHEGHGFLRTLEIDPDTAASVVAIAETNAKKEAQMQGDPRDDEGAGAAQADDSDASNVQTVAGKKTNPTTQQRIETERAQMNRTLDSRTKDAKPRGFAPVWNAIREARVMVQKANGSAASKEAAKRHIARAAIAAGLIVPDQNILIDLVDRKDFAAKDFTPIRGEVYRRLAGGYSPAEAEKRHADGEPKLHAGIGDVQRKIVARKNGPKILFDIAKNARPLSSVERDKDGNYRIGAKIYSPETMKGILMSLRATSRTLNSVLNKIPKLKLKHPQQKVWLAKVAREMARRSRIDMAPQDNKNLVKAIERRISDTAANLARQKENAFGAAFIGSLARKRTSHGPFKVSWSNWKVKFFLRRNKLRDVREIDTREANEDMINRMMASDRRAGNERPRSSYKLPNWSGAKTYDATVGPDGLQIARIHAWFRGSKQCPIVTNKIGRWLGPVKRMTSLTAKKIQDVFALPQMPTSWSSVKLPPGTRIRVSIVAPQDKWGKGGEIQIYVLSKLDKEWYSLISWSFHPGKLP